MRDDKRVHFLYNDNKNQDGGMDMQTTSAGANKLLRKLEDDKQFLLSQESAASTYVVTEGAEAIVPEYHYRETAEKLEKIETKVRKIKHALNVFNSTTVLEGLGITIDEALVKMAQLNQRKTTLDTMRRRLEKQRMPGYGRGNVVEYTCINYDLEEIQADYQALSQQIIEIQMALDLVNQTRAFTLDCEY